MARSKQSFVKECTASEAQTFTLMADGSGIPDELRARRMHTLFPQRIPMTKSCHRHNDAAVSGGDGRARFCTGSI